jgi:hypothetical protein
MKTYKDDGVAPDDHSTIQSPDKFHFHEGDQYAGREYGHKGARLSRDSSITPTMDCKKAEERSCMRLPSGM